MKNESPDNPLPARAAAAGQARDGNKPGPVFGSNSRPALRGFARAIAVHGVGGGVNVY